MLKVKAQSPNGRILLLFGLSNQNIKRLKKGQPILFPLDDFGYEGVDVSIIHGDTEQSMKEDLQKGGLDIK